MPAVRCFGWGRWLTAVVRMPSLPPWIMLALAPPGGLRRRAVRCEFRGRIDEDAVAGRVYVYEADEPTGNTP